MPAQNKSLALELKEKQRFALVLFTLCSLCCSYSNLQDLCTHPVLISFQSPSQLNIWISCFSVFCSKNLQFVTCQYPWISVTSYIQTSSKNILFSVSLLPFQLPTLPRIPLSTCPNSSKTLALYKSYTYLLVHYFRQCFTSPWCKVVSFW